MHAADVPRLALTRHCYQAHATVVRSQSPSLVATARVVPTCATVSDARRAVVVVRSSRSAVILQPRELCLDCSLVVAAAVKVFSSDKVKISGTPKKYTQTHDTSSGKLTHRYFCGECGSPTHAEGDIAPGKSAVKVSLFGEPPPAPVGEGFWRNAAGAASHFCM